MKIFFKKLHLWLSLPAGIFVIILCATGAILTFQTELQRIIDPHYYYADMPAGSNVMGYAYIIHTGTWGGWITKLLYLVACMGGIFLTVSGYWLYIRRISGKSQNSR